MSSSPTRLAPLLTTSARLPSGVIATATGSAAGGVATAAVGWVATDTVPTDFTFLPSIASTVTESSARLATSANVPAWLQTHNCEESGRFPSLTGSWFVLYALHPDAWEIPSQQERRSYGRLITLKIGLANAGHRSLRGDSII